MQAHGGTTGQEGTEIGPEVVLAEQDLLATHELRRTEDHALLRQHHRARPHLALGDLRQTEVEHLGEVPDATLSRDEDVLRLEVSVGDALVVRGGHGLGQLLGEGGEVLGGGVLGRQPRDPDLEEQAGRTDLLCSVEGLQDDDVATISFLWTPNEAVGTVKKSMPAKSWTWLSRKVRHVCEGGFG